GLAEKHIPLFKDLRDALQVLPEHGYEEFRSKDLTLLLSDHDEFVARRSDPTLYTHEILELLQTLSHELYLRSAELCAVVAFGSVANLLEVSPNLVVALDSRLAREVPLFWEHFDKTMQTKLKKKQVVSLQLVQPLRLEGESISVPMMGASNALDDLYCSLRDA
ncbi:MAG: hypothetical protein KDD62_15455, partial [Bdellovibrionales bacterium]|nr:hypothetical protein [Bdellovibrionales bacterium]